MADLEHGQAIEFVFEEDPRTAMIQSKLSEEQDDGATHVIEFVDGGRGPHGNQQERVTLVAADGLFDPGSGILISGRLAPDGVPYKFRGYHLPPLPEHKEHKCTDCWFLFVFFAALLFLGWVMSYAFKNGNVYNLHHAFDYKGDMCGVDLPTKRFGFWCMSNDGNRHLRVKYPICVESCPTSNETLHECFDPLTRNVTVNPSYRSRLHGMSPYCWPIEPDLLAWIKEKRSQHMRHPAKLFIAIPKNAWMIFPISAFIAATVGYIYFRLLEKCVDCIVVIFIFFTTNLSLVFGCWQLYSYTQYGGDGWLYGLGLISLSMVACRIFFSGNAQAAVSNAAGCIEAACECIHQDWSLLWEPMIALIIRMTLLLSLLVTLVLLVTCGAPRRIDSDSVRREFYFSPELEIYLYFVVFMLIWLMEMCTSTSQYVLAWATERWYFTPYVNDQKLEWSRNAVCRGYVHLVRKHLGTVALGSLLIVIIRIPRVILKVVRAAAESAFATGNPLCVCIAMTWYPCVRLSEKCDHVSKNAYLGVALTSESFARGAVSAYHTLHSTDEAQSVAWLNGMQGFFQIGGLLAMTAASGAGTLLATQVFNFFGPDIKVRNVVILLATATGFPIGIGYMTLFDTIGDTILYCWAVQQRRWNYHVNHSRVQAEDDGSFSAMVTSYFKPLTGDCDDSFTKVNYAPPALRELVLGRHRKIATLPCLPSSDL